jgi:hypothetical protein
MRENIEKNNAINNKKRIKLKKKLFVKRRGYKRLPTGFTIFKIRLKNIIKTFFKIFGKFNYRG